MDRTWRIRRWQLVALSEGLPLTILVRTLVFLFLCAFAAGASALVSDPGTALLERGSTKVPLTQYARIVRDDGARLSADTLLRRQACDAAPDGREFISLGTTRDALWLCIPLYNSESTPLQRLLVFDPSWLEDLQVLLYQQHDLVQSFRLGALRPFADRTLAQRLINHEVSVPPGDSLLLVRVQSRDPLDIDLTLWEQGAYFEAQSNEAIFWGAIYGILGAMLLYNLFLYVSVRDLIYVAYAAYLLMFLVLNATLNGQSYQYFWPDSPGLNKWVLATSVYAYALSGIYFGCRFLDLRSRLPAAYRMARGAAGVMAGSFVLTALLDGYRWNILLAPLWVIVSALFMVTVGFLSLRRGNRAARYFLTGTVSGFIGSSTTACTTLGFLPFTFWTYRAVDFGMVVDAILLSFALADRISIIRKDKDIAYAKVREINEHLEERVGQRTHELEMAKTESDAIIASLPGIFYVLGQQGQFMRVNDQFLKVSGYSKEDLGHLTALDFFAGEEKKLIAQKMQEAFRLGGAFVEASFVTKSGTIIPYYFTGHRASIDGQHFLVGLGIDISERRRIEQSLTESMHKLEEKDQSKNRFLAAAGHDLRQPLSAANLFIDALKFTEPTRAQEQIIQHLDQSMSAFNGLLDALLNISQLDAGIIKPKYDSIQVAGIFSWLEQGFAPLAQEKQLGFRLHFPVKERLVVRSDMDMLRPVLMNLVSNAIKYTARGTILVSARRRGGEVLFQVWDTGIGIESEQTGRIFDEFYQVNNPQRDRASGLGLGLAIARRAISLLGGEITCRSQVGRGSVFGFCVPLDPVSSEGPRQAATAVPRSDAINESFARGKRFILVEDDKLVAQAMVSLLEGAGGEVMHFNNADDALRHADGEAADYYIADYMLGGTLNGIQFLHELRRKLGRPVNAVLVTGDTSPDFVREAASCDWPVLHKPVNSARLFSSLRAQEGRTACDRLQRVE